MPKSNPYHDCIQCPSYKNLIFHLQYKDVHSQVRTFLLLPKKCCRGGKYYSTTCSYLVHYQHHHYICRTNHHQQQIHPCSSELRAFRSLAHPSLIPLDNWPNHHRYPCHILLDVYWSLVSSGTGHLYCILHCNIRHYYYKLDHHRCMPKSNPYHDCIQCPSYKNLIFHLQYKDVHSQVRTFLLLPKKCCRGGKYYSTTCSYLVHYQHHHYICRTNHHQQQIHPCSSELRAFRSLAHPSLIPLDNWPNHHRYPCHILLDVYWSLVQQLVQVVQQLVQVVQELVEVVQELVQELVQKLVEVVQ